MPNLVLYQLFVPVILKKKELPGGSKPQKEEYQFLWVIATTDLLHEGF